ncbi:hypothetical protein GCM10010983_28300 [Caulobacter rhizosphaerae]|nr:hypothetical protein GCM10010983_28300 [Caulobacter rhizosphaerae]
MDYGTALTANHTAALDWFAAHAGETVPWSDLNKRDQRLAIIPKGTAPTHSRPSGEQGRSEPDPSANGCAKS